MALLHSELPQYLRENAKPFYRRARLAHRGKTAPTAQGDPSYDIWDWAILAPGSDDVAKGADGKLLQFTTKHPSEIQALKALVVELNRGLDTAPEKPAKKGA